MISRGTRAKNHKCNSNSIWILKATRTGWSREGQGEDAPQPTKKRHDRLAVRETVRAPKLPSMSESRADGGETDQDPVGGMQRQRGSGGWAGGPGSSPEPPPPSMGQGVRAGTASLHSPVKAKGELTETHETGRS